MKEVLDLWRTRYQMKANTEILQVKESEDLFTKKNSKIFKSGTKNENLKISSIPRINSKTKNFFSNIRDIDKKPESISNLFIVPGDVIYLEQGRFVPCDCLILDGYCSVIEAYLTGESNHILKEALAKTNSKFSYENTKSILFQGTVINKCESSYSENGVNYIKCLVINTGFNTYWGSFLQNILFPKKMNFKFYRELRIFINFMIFSFIITFSIRTYFYVSDLVKKNQDNKNKSDNVEKSQTIIIFIIQMIDMLTVIMPPTLHICMSLASFYYNEILRKKNITCLSEKRLNAAGKVNIVVLDKTGTLTTDGLEISGFQTTEIKYDHEDNLDYLGFDGIEKSLDIFNSMHREFWMRFCTDYKNTFYDDYLINWKNNPIYFVECIATCLSIDKLRDNNILGNTMDKELFKIVGWDLEKLDQKWHDINVKLYFYEILKGFIL